MYKENPLLQLSVQRMITNMETTTEMIKDFITNEQCLYFGLEPIGSDWEVVEYRNRQNDREVTYLLFDGDTIRRLIRIYEGHYEEIQLQEQTAEGRTLLLPKTKRGKPKVLNFAATQALNGESVQEAGD